jgi:predicted RNase H-like nuclease (RuvC/YqgF family)
LQDNSSEASSTVSPCITSKISAAAETTIDMTDCYVNEPEESYNVEDYYKKELEQKEKEIVHLKKQLENSKKLVQFYKAKSTDLGDASDAAAHTTNFKLDQAVQAVITDTIKLD